MPVDVPDNLPDFTNCLGAASAIVEECEVQLAYLLGDYNAHPGAQFGHELLRYCADQLWVCADINRLGADSSSYTYLSESHGCRRWLDHCITTAAAWETVVSVKVIEDVLTSDHLPLVITCDMGLGDVSDGPTTEVKKANLNHKVIWGSRDTSQIDTYYEYCMSNLLCVNESMDDDCYECESNLKCMRVNDHILHIDEFYKKVIHILQAGAIMSSDMRSGGKNKRKKIIGWNYHVRECHQRARMHFQMWVLAGRPTPGDLFENMRSSRSAFKNKLKWCINNEEAIKMDILATARGNKNFSQFWKATRKLNAKEKLPSSVDGMQDPEAIAELFARRFKVDPEPVGCVPDAAPQCADSSQTPLIQFTAEQVAKVVKSVKRGKSPGHDGLSIEHILYAGPLVSSGLAHLFNRCIRYSYLPDALMRTVVVPIVKNKTGNLGTASNYRPISLGTVIGKILERLLQPELVNNIKIDDSQFGFRPGLSTDSAILSLKHIVNYYTGRDTSIYACFLDLSKAFDLVNYEILWDKLRSSQVRSEIVGLLRYWYGSQTNCVRWGDSTSSAYMLDCGVRQGGLTSPDLFSLYINGLIEELRSTKIGCHIGGVCVNTLSYADDMVLLCPSIGGLRKLLSICERYAGAHGLKYNVQKTEMMVFKAGRGPERVPKLLLNGSPVRRVHQFKYLGHVLTDDLRDDLDIERERRALCARGNMLARRFAKCNKSVKVTLFRAYCQCMYTCQLWTSFTRKALSTLRVQYNDAFRILVRLPRYCSASGMFADARVPDFFAIMRTRVASFRERVLASGNEVLKAVCDTSYSSPIFQYWRSIHQNANRK